MDYDATDRLQLYSLSNYRHSNYEYLKYMFEYIVYPHRHTNIIYCECIKCDNCDDINHNFNIHRQNYSYFNEEYMKAISRNHVLIGPHNYGKCDLSLYCIRCDRRKKLDPPNESNKFNKLIHKDKRYQFRLQMTYDNVKTKCSMLSVIPFIMSFLLCPFTLCMMMMMIISDLMRSIIEFIICRCNDVSYRFINMDQFISMNIFQKIGYLLRYTYDIMYKAICNKIRDERIKNIEYFILPLLGSCFYGNLILIAMLLLGMLVKYPKHLTFIVILLISTISHTPFILINYVYIIATYMFYMLRITIVDFVINRSAFPVLHCDERYHSFENPGNQDDLIYVDDLIAEQRHESANIANMSYTVIVYQIITLIPKTLIFIGLSFFNFVIRFLVGK